MRAFICGINGQLGRDLAQVFAEEGEAGGGDLPGLDIADAAAVRRALDAFGPDVVINSAAYTNVDAAEDHEADAFRANETGARTVAEAAAQTGCPVVYVSTDYVFGGTKSTPYEPDDALAPIGVYARSKAAGEAAVRAAHPQHYIVRTAWLYGPGGNNFPEKILRAAAARPALKVVQDEVGSPTHTWDLAQALHALVKTDCFGTYHGVNNGQCSRFEWAQTLLELAGIETPVAPCAASEFPAKAERPAYSVLSPATLEAAAGCRLRPWQDALAHYMQRRTAHAGD